MRNQILVFTLLIFGNFLVGQDFSNKGKEFWLAYPAHIDGTASVMGIYLTSNINASGTIDAPGNTPIPFTITANQVTRIFLGGTGNPTNTGVYLGMANDKKAGSGIKITADKNIVVYSHVIRSARSGATLVLPTSVLGIEYVIPSYQSRTVSGNNSGISQFQVVATQANTVIEISPTFNRPAIGSRPAVIAGQKYRDTLLNPGDCYQVQSNPLEDVSGTIVRSISTTGSTSCKPIAVFSGSTWATIGCEPSATSPSGGDNLFQQLFPTRSWGKTFVTAPFFGRNEDIYRIFILKAGTNVTVKENGISRVLGPADFRSSNNLYQIQSGNPLEISSDNPICVVQYITSATCKTGCASNSNQPNCYADPEMVILNPVEQTLSDITFFSAHRNYVPAGQTQISNHYVNIIISKNFKNSLKIDNAPPIGTFIDISGTNYAYIQADVTTSSGSNPVHNVKADTSFSAIVYGYGNVESYGYNAGSNVKDLSQFVSIKNTYAKVDFPATCKLAPFNFSVTVPYKTAKLDWDFGTASGFQKETNSAPVPDSIIKKKSGVEDSLFIYRLSKTYMYPNTGTYPVDITLVNLNSDGCTGEQVINYQVQVYDRPKVGFYVITNNCLGTDIQLKDTSNGFGRSFIKYNWDIGDGKTYDNKNINIKTDTIGTYAAIFSAITDIGCISDTIRKTISIDSIPSAKFSITSLTCQNKEVTFSDQSSSKGKSTLSKWYWNFNDGSKIDTLTTNTTVKRAYTSLQTYAPSLIVETVNGCKSSVSSIVFTNNPNPVAAFKVGGICLPDGNGKFTNNSSIADGSLAQLKYRWIFGDPNASTSNPDTLFNVKDPVHRYQTTGPFTIKLNVESIKGCVDSIVQQLTDVFPQPKASFSVTPEVCLRESTGFKDLSEPKAGTMTGWVWKFSNGVQSSEKDPLVLFSNAGTYTATFYGTTSNGCNSDTIAKTFVVHPLPTPAFKIIDPACETETVKFIQESIANVGTITRWNWKLGNAASHRDVTDVNTQVTSSFASWGDQVIRLMVENAKGCKSDTLLKTIKINPKPIVGFTIPEVCLNDASANFTSTSTIADNKAMTYAWNFGDPNATQTNPNTGNGITISHKYSAARNYIVALEVTSVAGCVSNLSQTFTVNGATPKAGFNVINTASLCSNVPVSIENTSEVDFGSVSKLEIYWDYVNKPGTFFRDEDPTPNKIYKNLYTDFLDQPTKTFTIRVRAFSGGTCVDDELKTITLKGSPMVSFKPLPGICLEALPRQIKEATFTDVSGIAGGKDLYSGPGVNPTGLYTASSAGAGTYTITYRFTSSNSCYAESYSNITVWPRPTADYVYSNLNCEKNPIQFTTKSVANAGSIVKWNWNYNDGSVIESVTNANPISHVFTKYGSYTVSLDVLTDNGCTSEPKAMTIKVNPLPVIDFQLPKVCLPIGKALFVNNTSIPDGSGNLLTYLWDFGDPADRDPSVSKDGSHNYLSLGSYLIKLVSTSNNNCKDSLSKTLTDVFPQPKAGFASADSACIGTAIQFSDTSSGIVRPIDKWLWDFGNGATSSSKDPFYTYPNPGNFTVKLSVITNEGCLSDTAIKSIMIHPYPVVSAGPDMFVLDDGQKQLKATASGQALRFKWSPATYLSNVDSLNPFVIRPQDDILYTLSVTGRGNCTSKDEVFIVSLKMPNPPNTFTPNGDGINDVWAIKYLDQYPGAILEIYSTQGQLLFRSVEYPKPWDGTFNGKILPSGTYYYVIDPKSGRKKVAGYVTIFK